MLLDCTSCEARVDALVLHTYAVNQDFGPAVRFSLARCPQCNNPLLTSEVEGMYEWEAPQRLYPGAENGLGVNIPPAVAYAFTEAQTCFRARAYTACALMCRRSLESIAADHFIKASNLAGALREMQQKGIVEKRLFEWADALRTVGNEAAHDVDRPISAEDATDTLDFTRALIEYVYAYQEKFAAFQKRRVERDNTG